MPSHDAPNRPRIVIVDDNLELAENIAEILSVDGYASEVFGSLTSARRADIRRAAVLRKPLDLAQLSETIRTLTGFGAQ